MLSDERLLEIRAAIIDRIQRTAPSFDEQVFVLTTHDAGDLIDALTAARAEAARLREERDGAQRDTRRLRMLLDRIDCTPGKCPLCERYDHAGDCALGMEITTTYTLKGPTKDPGLASVEPEETDTEVAPQREAVSSGGSGAAECAKEPVAADAGSIFDALLADAAQLRAERDEALALVLKLQAHMNEGCRP
jgi:hypothetical protein